VLAVRQALEARLGSLVLQARLEQMQQAICLRRVKDNATP